MGSVLAPRHAFVAPQENPGTPHVPGIPEAARTSEWGHINRLSYRKCNAVPCPSHVMLPLGQCM
jgi:hypothetical protein